MTKIDLDKLELFSTYNKVTRIPNKSHLIINGRYTFLLPFGGGGGVDPDDTATCCVLVSVKPPVSCTSRRTVWVPLTVKECVMVAEVLQGVS